MSASGLSLAFMREWFVFCCGICNFVCAIYVSDYEKIPADGLLPAGGGADRCP